jgi:hypothetical protein
MLRTKWSPKHLIAEMASLLDAGWAAIAYWFEQSSGQKSGFMVAGPSPSDQARAREAFMRIHAEGGMPAMRYHVSLRHDPPIVEDEICRASRDGICVVACDFTHLAALSERLHLNTRADVVQEEREKCEEIINALVQRRDAFRAKN